jgi:hypothetical protein
VAGAKTPLPVKTNLRVRVIVLKRGKKTRKQIEIPQKKGRKFLLKTFLKIL